MLTVTFSQRQYIVNESDARVTVGLELNRPAGQHVTIGVRSIPNTAQGIITALLIFVILKTVI